MTTLAFTRPLRRLDESVVIAREYGFDVIAAPSLDIVHGRSEDYSDIKKKLMTYVEASSKPILEHPEDDNYVDLYDEFYDELLKTTEQD